MFPERNGLFTPQKPISSNFFLPLISLVLTAFPTNRNKTRQVIANKSVATQNLCISYNFFHLFTITSCFVK